jgi:hypothetical protein
VTRTGRSRNRSHHPQTCPNPVGSTADVGPATYAWSLGARRPKNRLIEAATGSRTIQRRPMRSGPSVRGASGTWARRLLTLVFMAVTDSEARVEHAGSPRRRTGPALAGLVLLALAAFVAILATSIGDEDQQTSRLVGRFAPPVEGTSLFGGEFSLDAHRGQYVVVHGVPLVGKNTRNSQRSSSNTPSPDKPRSSRSRIRQLRRQPLSSSRTTTASGHSSTIPMA